MGDESGSDSDGIGSVPTEVLLSGWPEGLRKTQEVSVTKAGVLAGLILETCSNANNMIYTFL
jgi:hypothetical protein